MKTEAQLDQAFKPTHGREQGLADSLAAARWKDKLFLGWHGANVLLFMGTVTTCMIGVVDRTLVPLANALAISLVASWILLMASQIVSAIRDGARSKRERRAELEAVASGMNLTPEQIRTLQHDVERIYGPR
jgi:hypothetical protein